LAREGGTADAWAGARLRLARRPRGNVFAPIVTETQRVSGCPREAKPSICPGEASAVPPHVPSPPLSTLTDTFKQESRKCLFGEKERVIGVRRYRKAVASTNSDK